MKHFEAVENSATLALEARGFRLWRLDELPDELAGKLVVASTEPEMLEQVPEDHDRRFPDVERALEWYKERERTMYALGARAHLAGVAWFTQRSFPGSGIDAEYTLAIRLYERARNQGLGKAVLEATDRDFRLSSHYEGPTWLSVKDANIHAKRLYDKFDYSAIRSGGGRTLMVRPGSVGYGTEAAEDS